MELDQSQNSHIHTEGFPKCILKFKSKSLSAQKYFSMHTQIFPILDTHNGNPQMYAIFITKYIFSIRCDFYAQTVQSALQLFMCVFFFLDCQSTNAFFQ